MPENPWTQAVETKLLAELDRSVSGWLLEGRDNRYAADSTMVIVNQGI